MPSEDVVRGVTAGILDWSESKIDGFVEKFKERKLAFIAEPKTIETVKEIYRSGEAKFYQSYIGNAELLLIVKLGLTLRKLENDNNRLTNLRDKIFKKYKIRGLHIAEFVQNGVLNKYIGILLEELTSIENLKKEIEDILTNIEKYTLFVQGTDKKSEILKNASNKLSVSPDIFIIAGFKSAAKIVFDVTDSLKIIFKYYDLEKISGGEKEILFFKRKLPKV